MDEPYSKRELDHFFQELNAHLSHQDEALMRIEAQTMKTNGRVTKLEQWRSALIWGFGTLIAVIVGIFRIHFNFNGKL